MDEVISTIRSRLTKVPSQGMLLTIGQVFRCAEQSRQVGATLTQQEPNKSDGPGDVHKHPDDQKLSHHLCLAEDAPIEKAHRELDQSHSSDPNDHIGQL